MQPCIALQEFPLVQQGYALFLEACNCYTFNQALARCMTAKLQVRMHALLMSYL